MKQRLFTDMNESPTEALLRKGLGPAMDYYHGFVSKAADFRRQWQYSRGNGWIMKVDDTRKALFYLTPLQEGLEISLTVRESERDALLKSDALDKLHSQLMSATRYSEGYALRFDVESLDQYRPVMSLLTELIAIRSIPAKSSRK
jgi:hypothetical protein